jgi:hypothetical protein
MPDFVEKLAALGKVEAAGPFDLPSLTLIFSANDPSADEGVLLDMADQAIDVIEEADERFSIVKAFTFYAGEVADSDRQNLGRVGDVWNEMVAVVRMSHDLYWTMMLSSGPPGYLIRQEQLQELESLLAALKSKVESL